MSSLPPGVVCVVVPRIALRHIHRQGPAQARSPQPNAREDTSSGIPAHLGEFHSPLRVVPVRAYHLGDTALLMDGEQAYRRGRKAQPQGATGFCQEALLPEVVHQAWRWALQAEAGESKFTRHFSLFIPVKISQQPPGAEIFADGQSKQLRTVLLEQVERPRCLTIRR